MEILACQEGCCQEEPEHWTPAVMAAAIVETYIGEFRASMTIRPIPQKIWQHIQKMAGHSLPPTSPYRPVPDVVQRKRRHR